MMNDDQMAHEKLVAARRGNLLRTALFAGRWHIHNGAAVLRYDKRGVRRVVDLLT